MTKKGTTKFKPDLPVSKEDVIFKKESDNTIIVRFDKIFNNEELKVFNIFVLKKKQAYASKNDLICNYINYFIKHYDYDNELLQAYQQLKFMIDDNVKYGKQTFIYDLYDYLMTDTMVEKIEQMTSDLYHIDLEEAKASKRKKYPESLQFINEHGEIFMNISVAMKIMIPLVTHYTYKNHKKKINKFLVKVFTGLLEIFQKDHDLYNKLYETVLSRVNATLHRDKVIWKQGEIRGEDPQSQASELLDKLITDIFPQYTYSGNIVSFNSVALDFNVRCKKKVKYKLDLKPVTSTKDADGLSGFDKMEINTAKFDESLIVINQINLKQTISKLAEENFIKFKKKEVAYYADKEIMKVEPFQRDLIFGFFAKYFGSSRELRSARKEYAKLIILLKTMLENRGFNIIQHILTAQLVEYKHVKRNTKKQMQKVKSSPRYQSLVEYKYSSTSKLFDKNLEDIVDIIVNSKFALVDYTHRDKTGKIINTKNKDVICDELLRFMEEI